MATTHKLVVVVKRSSEEFLVVRQTPPPMPAGEEYQSFVDSDLWELPSAPLELLEGECESELVVQGAAGSYLEKLDLRGFDVGSALEQALSRIGMGTAGSRQWEYWKYVEDAEFGPGALVHMVFILRKLEASDVINLQGCGRWISIQGALKLLLDVKPNDDRLGPLVVMGLLSDSAAKLRKWEVPPSLHFQEYPPGVTLVPLRSRTAKPFWTTNLVVVAPNNVKNYLEDSRCIAYGDALVMDPGCCSEFHSQLEDIMAALPRKLVLFVTHHHYDHIDGLSVVQKCNPDAILLAHENTMKRIGKEKWPLRYTPVSGGEKICIGGQLLEVINSPGHTDGHMALHHVSTNSLVVGDHCVGQGSAVLDVTSGGNMKDYFQTTYNFMELSPHIIIPMHGRLSLWPKQMLCGYLKHRRDREASIFKAIESGATTLLDILSISYADVDAKFWPGASSNVRIHVDHLAYQEKLPKEFSMQKFQASCRLHFLSRWAWRYVKCGFSFIGQKSTTVALLVAVGLAGLAIFCL